MLLLEALIRYPTIALSLLFAVFILRDGWRNPSARYAAGICIALAAILLGTAPEELKLPAIPYAIVRFIDFPTIVFVWWFGRSMFEDDFRLGILEWSGMVALALPILAFRLHEFGFIDRPHPFADMLIQGVSLAMMLHLVNSTIKGRRDDLVEARRRMRMFFVIALALVTGLTVLSEVFFARDYFELVNLFRGAIALPMVIWAFLWLGKLHFQRLSFEPVQKVEPQTPTIDPRDQGTYDALNNLMEKDKVYREPGLTIRKLAEQLQTPEHQLRALINKGMGYRNFSGFLNHYRIQAVKDAMAQSENARIPVLTLAMDVGFNSLAPFNRAFREIVGETPTQYRNKIVNKNNGPAD